MKKLMIIVGSVILLLLPSFVFSQTEQMTTGVPPISQPLIREGDLAIKLVEALKLGTAKNEGEAETILGSIGIAPKNGWIADYPVTPDIIGELQIAIGGAAEAGRLPMTMEEALKSFEVLMASLELPIVADASGGYTGGEPPRGYGSYSDPTVINNYYYAEGPPVVTYYPPPWDYYYLYSWVSWPFWCYGHLFHGFFVLHHFHKPIFVHNKVVVVTNRVVDPTTKKVFVVDPVKRGTGKFSTIKFDRRETSRFNSADGRRGASSIVERSRERTRGPGNDVTVRPSHPSGRRGEGSLRQSTPDRPMRREQFRTGGREPVRSGRAERTFTAPRRGGGRPFSAPSLSNRGPSGGNRSGRSTEGFSRASGRSGSGRSFHGFSGGRSGGCRGRC